MSITFTEYIEMLEDLGEGVAPEQEEVEEILATIWGALRSALRQRGLWCLPPSYLGLNGPSGWPEIGNQRVSLSESNEKSELAVDCYQYVLVDRYRLFARLVREGWKVDGLAFRRVQDFIHETQRRNDLLGYRVFSVLHAAVLRAIDLKKLYVLKGSGKVRNGTILGFGQAEGTSPCGTEFLDVIVRTWNDSLLPEIITANGEARKAVVKELCRLVMEMKGLGVSCFCFGDIIRPLKSDIRIRWAAMFDQEDGSPAWEEREKSLEERDSRTKLEGCISKKLHRLSAPPATLRYLEIFWNFLRYFLVAKDDYKRFRDLYEALGEGALSQRKLAEVLGIPRKQMPRLFGILQGLAEECRAALSGRSRSRAGGSFEGSGRLAKERRTLASLAQATADARDRSLRDEQRSDRPLGPGDLFVHSNTRKDGIAWVILQERETGRDLLVVPADDRPLAGSSDIHLPSEAGGPLTLRCGLETWLDRRAIGSALRAETLPRLTIEEALEKWRQRKAGVFAGTVLEQEVDADPEYVEWVEEVLKPACKALASDSNTRHPTARKERRNRSAAPIAFPRGPRNRGGAAVTSEDVGRGGPRQQVAVAAQLMRWNRGDETALDDLMPLVSDELRRIAARYFQREDSGHTLQPTAVVNEVYIHLASRRQVSWKDRDHFFGFAAQTMRRILVDHARTRKAEKRGKGIKPLPLEEVVAPIAPPQRMDLIALDEALERLLEIAPRQARVVELRFFVGLSYREISEMLGVTERTVKRAWETARLWLHKELLM